MLISKPRNQVFVLLVAALMLVWSTAVWDCRRAESQALAHASQQTAAWAMTFASEAESTFKYVDHALITLRQTWLTHPSEIADGVVLHKNAMQDVILQVAIIDAKGYLVYSNLGIPTEPTYLGDREHFTVHGARLQDALFVSRPVKGRVSGKWSIQLTRPMFRQGQFAGVIVISVDPDHFVKFYGATGFGRDGAARMVRDTGEIMARSSEQDRYVGMVIKPSPYADPGAPQRGEFRRAAQADGVDRLSSYYRLPQYGLTVVVGPSVEDILAPVRAQQHKTVFVASVVTLLVCLVAWQLMRNLARQSASHRTLVEDEERFRTIFDILPIGVSLGDRTGHILDCNAATEKLFGISKAEYLSRDYRTRDWTFLRHDGTPMPLAEFATVRALAEQRAVVDVTMEVRKPSGSTWLSVNAIPLDHPRYGVLTAFVDITQRVRAEAEVRQIMHAASDAISIFNMAGRCTFANHATCALLGYSKEEMLALQIDDLLFKDDLRQFPLHVAQLQSEPSVRREWSLRHKGGSPVLMELVTQQLDHDRFLTMGREIGARKRAERALQLAASVFTHAREGIMITDAQGTIVDLNDTFTRITGFERAEALGQNPRILNSGLQAPEYYAAMWKTLLNEGHWSGEVWNRRKSGEVYAEMQTVSAVRDAAGRTQNYVALFSDITPMKEHQRQLEHIAHYDALTHLPNRVLLADRLLQALIQSQRRGLALAVVFLDLDGFKVVNDTHGHAVGDTLLIAVSQRMKAALRQGDTLARIGGDEFVAILVDLEDAQDCEPVLARLLQAASEPVTVGESSLQVSASMGVTMYPQDGSDADLLMRHADQAMYAAKHAGKNRYHLFDVAQEAAISTRRQGIDRMRQAIDAQEFVLHYQPKVDMRKGTVAGAEALIRWQHPERGLLAPAEFLPTLEDHPLGIELGEWVLDTALLQMSRWQKVGLHLPVSINMAAQQLQQDNFADRLMAALAAHPDVPAHWLELEVLETSAMKDMDTVARAMQVCRALGVRFALDDFGTGYSSLAYLRHLPAETLKIDQSFVRDMLFDNDDRAIVMGVIGLAVAFGRGVIAEGVETAEHGTQLLAMGCDLAQGYGIARPMPAAAMAGWVARWRSEPHWVK